MNWQSCAYVQIGAHFFSTSSAPTQQSVHRLTHLPNSNSGSPSDQNPTVKAGDNVRTFTQHSALHHPALQACITPSSSEDHACPVPKGRKRLSAVNALAAHIHVHKYDGTANPPAATTNAQPGPRTAKHNNKGVVHAWVAVHGRPGLLMRPTRPDRPEASASTSTLGKAEERGASKRRRSWRQRLAALMPCRDGRARPSGGGAGDKELGLMGL